MQAAFGELASLTYVQLWKCQLESLPPTLPQLRRLRKLDLANNKLSSDTLGELRALTNLRKLDIKGNPFTSVPEGLAELPHMEKLASKEGEYWY